MYTVCMVHYKYRDNVRSMHDLDSTVRCEPVKIVLQGAEFIAYYWSSI